jgi:hypothetical protein
LASEAASVRFTSMYSSMVIALSDCSDEAILYKQTKYEIITVSRKESSDSHTKIMHYICCTTQIPPTFCNLKLRNLKDILVGDSDLLVNFKQILVVIFSKSKGVHSHVLNPYMRGFQPFLFGLNAIYYLRKV